jgi:hypothetical protein
LISLGQCTFTWKGPIQGGEGGIKDIDITDSKEKKVSRRSFFFWHCVIIETATITPV